MRDDVERTLLDANLAQPRQAPVAGQLTEAERERLAARVGNLSGAIMDERGRRWRDPEVVQRAMLADVPIRLILGELWRRVLAWVDQWGR